MPNAHTADIYELDYYTLNRWRECIFTCENHSCMHSLIPSHKIISETQTAVRNVHKPGFLRSLIHYSELVAVNKNVPITDGAAAAQTQIMCFASHRMRMTPLLCRCNASPDESVNSNRITTTERFFKYSSSSRYVFFIWRIRHSAHEIYRYGAWAYHSCCRDYAGRNSLGNGTPHSLRSRASFAINFVELMGGVHQMLLHWGCGSGSRNLLT